jgi:hypothetical protein
MSITPTSITPSITSIHIKPVVPDVPDTKTRDPTKVHTFIKYLRVFRQLYGSNMLHILHSIIRMCVITFVYRRFNGTDFKAVIMCSVALKCCLDSIDFVFRVMQ